MKRIGIVTALAAEAACLIRTSPVPDFPVDLDENFSVILCGSGPERARRGAQHLMDSGVGGLISFGVAGGLTAALKSGDLILAESVVAGGARYFPDRTWRDRVLHRLGGAPMPVHGGALASTTSMVASAAEKSALHRATGAIAVDMESTTVLEAAARNGIPALAVRTVLDPAGLGIPGPVLRHSDAYGRLRPAVFFLDLCGRPSDLPDLFRLFRHYRAALKTLTWLAAYRDRILN